MSRNETMLLTNIKTTNGTVTFSVKMRSVSTVFVDENPGGGGSTPGKSGYRCAIRFPKP